MSVSAHPVGRPDAVGRSGVRTLVALARAVGPVAAPGPALNDG